MLNLGANQKPILKCPKAWRGLVSIRKFEIVKEFYVNLRVLCDLRGED